jgi:curved DNA-binding protein CbpA
VIIAEGTLTDRPLPRTFAAIAARGFSGELVVRGGGREFHIAWQDGAVVGATSPHAADSAAKIAVTLGILNSTQAGEIARVIAANPGCDEVEVVAQVGRLSTEIISRLGRRLAATRAARVFSVEQGTFALHSTLPPWGTMVPIDPRWIIYSGVRMHYTVDRLHREVTSLATAIRLRPDSDLSSFGFGEAEADALARLRTDALVLVPTPLGLDGRVVQAVALVLLAVGDAEPVSGSNPALRSSRRLTQRPASSPALRVPTPTRSRTPTQRRPRIADPSRTRAIIAERLAVLDGGADHFQLLGVAPEATGEEIRAAYFGLARHLHPDRLSAAGIEDERREAHRLFSKINEAFAVLSDEARRAGYQQVQRAGGARAVRAEADVAETKVRQALGGEEAYRRGEAALSRNQLGEALTQFRAAVELAPDEADHHAMLGWATYVAVPDKASAAPAARDHLRRALEKNERSALAHLLLGRVARMEGQDNDALAHLRRATMLQPRNEEIASELRALESRRGKGLASLFRRKKT